MADGFTDVAAKRRLYFKAIDDNKTKLPNVPKKQNYLDRAHLLPEVRPYEVSKQFHGLKNNPLYSNSNDLSPSNVYSKKLSNDGLLYMC